MDIDGVQDVNSSQMGRIEPLVLGVKIYAGVISASLLMGIPSTRA